MILKYLERLIFNVTTRKDSCGSGGEALIVKNMVSESPLVEKEQITIPALEKLLVDMLIDTTLFSAQQNEKEFIMRSAMKKYTLNELKMRRYAVRRNREQVVKMTKDQKF